MQKRLALKILSHYAACSSVSVPQTFCHVRWYPSANVPSVRRCVCLVNCCEPSWTSAAVRLTNTDCVASQIAASSDDPHRVLLASSTHALGQGVAPGSEVWVIPRDRRRATESCRGDRKKRVNPVFLFSKMPQISAAVCPTAKHCSGNDITVCHTFTLAIRFSLPLVAVSVMSPWYALTSAQIEVSHSVLTALSLCRDSVRN